MRHVLGNDDAWRLEYTPQGEMMSFEQVLKPEPPGTAELPKHPVYLSHLPTNSENITLSWSSLCSKQTFK